ncbi:DUF721 domain-containing protein [Parasulfitobacter algicola]|uniref:DUF721 domain-containing protein n=1 Tax=Parasulfitobacter algicola TaxID=2614809 RepID=A0ABX2ILM9_9RHOB|nr:DciA family protein [Sulfitobacter algicola]NSX53772.1 DUF721 domain-containing protein [Sulfitobacter algicola]
MAVMHRRSTTMGFKTTSDLLQSRIRTASEKRGFAVTRLLTHWVEIVGEATAKMAVPVKIGYGRDGIGATLTVLTKGAYGPMLQSQLPQLRDRVNACYGYNAISSIRITQTAPTGFAEGQVAFTPKPKKSRQIDPQVKADAQQAAEGVKSKDLRQALETLGANILSRPKSLDRGT